MTDSQQPKGLLPTKESFGDKFLGMEDNFSNTFEIFEVNLKIQFK